MNSNLFKGILLVSAGAASYGVLATIVRLAYNEGYTTIEATVSQYSTGLLVMGLLTLLSPRTRRSAAPDGSITDPSRSGNILRLVAGGTAYGLTGICYYFSVRYLPVSICVILLMQAIWMGILLDTLLLRKMPSADKCLAGIVVLGGTLMATNAIGNFQGLDPRGVGWGLAAALTYTVSLFVANRVAVNIPPREKSFWILTGGTAIILLIGAPQIFQGDFQFPIYGKWGPMLALFGTILPPLLLNMGMPKTGIGLGSILISIEIPVSVGLAYVLLHEQVLLIQWIGIALIIIAIVLLNLRTLRSELGLRNEQKPR